MQPPVYEPSTNFQQEETNQVAGRSTVRTAMVDAEYNNIATSINAILANLAIIQRDDGELRDQIVSIHTLDTDVANLIATANREIRGPWLTATTYAVGDIVTDGVTVYMCAVAHTSGVLATDIAAGKWGVLGPGLDPNSPVNFGATVTIDPGQLLIPVQGIGGGIIIGTDTQLYRSAADTLRTPDSLTIDGSLAVAGGQTVGTTLTVGTGLSAATLSLGPHALGTSTDITYRLVTADPDAGDFTFNLNDASVAFGTRNNVFTWGYNNATAQVRENVAEPCLGFSIESNFNTGSANQMELHIQGCWADGTTFRSWHWNFDRTTHNITNTFGARTVTFADQSLVKAGFQFQCLLAQASLDVTSASVIQKIVNNQPWLYQFNAAASGIIEIARVNATDQVVLAPGGGATVAAGSLSAAGQILHANGTAGSPSIAFTNSATTGFYRVGADNIGVATAGVARWSVTSAGHTVWGTDNTLDIGALGATRPRTGYFGTSVFTPLIDSGTSSTPLIYRAGGGGVYARLIQSINNAVATLAWQTDAGVTAFDIIENGDVQLRAAGTRNLNLQTGASLLQVQVVHTASANRNITLTGSNGGNPTIGVSAGSLAISPAVVMASTLSASQLTISTAAGKIIPGATSLSLRNNADSADNVLITDAGVVTVRSTLTKADAVLNRTTVAHTNNAAAATATLTNSPTVGNPTKWIPIDDNGTTRNIPAW